MTKKIEPFTFQVASIIFSKDGFNIVRTTQGDNVSGKFRALEGMVYKADGYWETHPTYGPQYKLQSAVQVRITDPAALGRFLALRMKGKGVGEAVIGNLVEACKDGGLDLEALLDRGDHATLVDCVGSRNAAKVAILLDWWPKIKPAADVMSPLLGYGLSEAQAESVVAIYGAKAVEAVEDRPYDLILRVDGISFIRADSIAMRVGRVGKTDTIRLRAALAAGLRDATSMGDIGVKRGLLLKKTMPLVNESVLEGNKRILKPGVELVVSEETLASVLDEMIRGVKTEGDTCGFASNLIEEPDAKGDMVVWYKPLVEAEKLIAQRVAAFNAPPLYAHAARVDEFAGLMGAMLDPAQKTAVEMVLLNPISVITGGPGVGKSFVQKVFLEMLDDACGKRTTRYDSPGALAAPTGKAAKRITESTGRPAKTMHSLIGFGAGGRCAFDQSSPLPVRYIDIDEASMVDTELFAATLNALPNSCRVVIIGDVDQLPSVGPGQVLRDLIRSKVIPVTRLTKGFRFGGGIKDAARTVNAGKYPETSEDGTFIVRESEEPAETVMESVKKLLAKGVSEDDIQLLAPTHKGDAGCIALNKAMQALLNPNSHVKTNQRLKRDGGDIFVGDRVIQLKNDKELNLVNGDVGWVTNIESSSGVVTLSVPGRPEPVKMTKQQAQHLALAFCITVHKSQGAEAPYVLLALDKAATFFLRRSIPYTGLTRASKYCEVHGPRAVISSAVRKGEPEEGSRRTSLVPKLIEAFKGRPPVATPTVPTATAPAPADPVAAAMLSDVDQDVPF